MKRSLHMLHEVAPVPSPVTIEGMPRKKSAPDKTPDPPPPPPVVAVIYLEVDPEMKSLMERLAKRHNRRLTGECNQALQEYLAKHGSPWPPADPAEGA